MSRRSSRASSVSALVVNRAKELGVSRQEAATSYMMDRLLFRLGRSNERKFFLLKGGVLIANLIQEPHRFTRDIDLLRTRAPAEPDHVRQSFENITRLTFDDGIVFERVSAVRAVRDADGYDGVRVTVRARVDRMHVEVKLDIGFGDATVPSAAARDLRPMLADSDPARVLAYAPETVIAEKVETVIRLAPALGHRMKDLYDVVVLADSREFEGPTLLET